MMQMEVRLELFKIRNTAKGMAEAEVNEEIDRLYGDESYKWIKNNREQYNEMVKAAYNKFYSEIKKLWILQNINIVSSLIDKP